MYQDYFTRTFDGTDYEEVTPASELIVASRRPLALAEIDQLLGWGSERRRMKFRRSLGSMFAEEGAGEEKFLVPFHTTLLDWLTDEERAGDYFASREDGHRRLAESGWAGYREGVSRLPDYMRSHLPAHLLRAGRWEDLLALLTDLAFLEAKSPAGAGLVAGLAADFLHAARAIPETARHETAAGVTVTRRTLELLGEALGRDLGFQARHPESLFQEIYNLAWWYDAPAAGRQYQEPEGGWKALPPWAAGGLKLHALLDSWRQEFEKSGRVWVVSCRPPREPLGSALRNILRGHEHSASS